MTPVLTGQPASDLMQDVVTRRHFPTVNVALSSTIAARRSSRLAANWVSAVSRQPWWVFRTNWNADFGGSGTRNYGRQVHDDEWRGPETCLPTDAG